MKYRVLLDRLEQLIEDCTEDYDKEVSIDDQIVLDLKEILYDIGSED